MKVAILHDYFDEIGGAEIILLTLARGVGAEIITTNIDRPAIDQLGFNDIKITSIGRVPRIKHLKQLAAQGRFAGLKLAGFDIHILGGSASIYAAARNKPNLWYCFSPERGLYDLRTPGHPIKETIKRVQIGRDQKAVKEIERIIAISREVKDRVKRYYQRDCTDVVYPPIPTADAKRSASSNYWLSVQRIDPYKKIELQLEAFRRMESERLVIAGGASDEFKGYFRRLQAQAPNNVQFIGPVLNRANLADLYAGSKGFIATSRNEDFGMTAVEAMAAGKPVIAPNEGGYKETVIPDRTGKLIDNLDSEQLARSIQEVGRNTGQYRQACLQQARRFNTDVFIKKMREHIGGKPACTPGS
jgi:glycosyltransferase involved in cell wall biosynthesis